MATDNESFNRDLYDLLKVRGYQPVPLDSKNQRVPASQAADVIQFTFTKDGEEYGKAWVSIDDAANVIVYYDEEQQESPSTTTPGAEYDDSWTGFLKHLKSWAQRRQLSFELSNKDRLGDDMRQRDYFKMKERVSEGYYPMGKKASYNDAVPSVKIILQHNRALEEGEQRYRNVAKIFLENQEGERFIAPTTRPGIARVYARHIAEGGVPNDDRWNHIKSICEDYNKMAGFVRATRNGQFNESATQMVQEGVNHYNNLRETLHKLTGHRGYQAYFESWTPSLMEDEGDDSITELFVQETMDPRIESAMPILSRLKKPVTEMEEVDTLAEWADGIISEKLDLDEPKNNVVSLNRKKIQPLGYDSIMPSEFDDDDYELPRIGKLDAMNRHSEDDMDWDDDSWIPDEEDFEHEEMAKELSRHRGRFAANDVNEMEKDLHQGSRHDPRKGPQGPDKTAKMMTAKKAMKDARKALDKAFRGDVEENFIGMAPQAVAEEEVDEATGYYDEKHPQHDRMTKDGYEHSIQDIQGKKMHRYFKPGTSLQDIFKYDDEEVKEDLGPEQKRVGQLGPTEKVKNNNIGKLVGANESTEIDPELARIMEMARFKR